MTRSKEKIYWAILAVLALLLVAALLWAANERTRAASEVQNQRTAMEQTHQAQQNTLAQEWQQRLTAQAADRQQVIDAEAVQLLRLTAVPLGWVARSEMSARNFGRLRGYFDDLITYPGVRNIELLDPSGKVLLATDLGREGLPMEASYPAQVQAVDQPTVFHVGGDVFVVAVPLFGLSAKQGTVVLAYDRSTAGNTATSPSVAPAEAGATPSAPAAPASSGADAAPPVLGTPPAAQ